ncbi:hypothetical protein [Nocardia pseudovaccinii]|uniref:hypothetical protein n=1 Tax=Nocardia pseudovaccinii TaxID=189540 RepID=UPI0007A554FB|nr:hypothetical protein [Nocardia pseudovaccinii]
MKAAALVASERSTVAELPDPVCGRGGPYRQLRLIGSLIYDHPSDFADTTALLDSGAIAPSRALQAEFALDDADRAFAAVRSTPGKCWIRLGRVSTISNRE